MSSEKKRLVHSHGERLFEHQALVHSSSLSEDGIYSMTSDDSKVMFWNIEKRSFIRSVPHNGYARCFISSNSERATSACDDGVIRIWNVRDGLFIRNVPYKNAQFDYASDAWVSPDGGILLAAYSKKNGNFGSELVSFDCFACEDNCMFISDKLRLDGNIWNISGSVQQNSASFLERSDDGIVSLQVLNLDDLSTTKLSYNVGVYEATTPRRETCVMSAATKSQTFAVASCESLKIFTDENEIGYKLAGYVRPDNVLACAINAEGTVVVAKCQVNFFGVWDLKTRTRTHILSCRTSNPTTCSISCNGHYLIAGCKDGEVRAYNLQVKNENDTCNKEISLNTNEVEEEGKSEENTNVDLKGIPSTALTICKGLFDEEQNHREKLDLLDKFTNLVVDPEEGRYRVCLEDNGSWWYWVDDFVCGKQTGWYPYSESANKILEELYLESKKSLRCATQIKVKSGTYSYAVNIKNMIQTNVSHPNRKSRQIRRQPTSIPIDNSAPPPLRM